MKSPTLWAFHRSVHVGPDERHLVRYPEVTVCSVGNTLAHARLFLPMHESGGRVKHCHRTDLKRTGPFGCGRTGEPKRQKVKLNGQCEKRTTEGTVEWTEQRTEDCAATGNPIPRGGERGRRRASQKQPTDRAASQRLRGGRLPLRPIQTSLIKLSNVRAD